MSEIWKAVLGYEGIYSVSSFGRLRRDKGSQNTPKGSITRGCKDKHYMRISLLKNGIRRTDNIHVLIAEAFLGIRPEGMYVNHIDGNKLNNRSDNLEYVTPKENIRKSVIAGTHPRGSRIHQSKLKEKDIPVILDLLFCENSCASIARRFGVHRQAISAIKRGITWKQETLKLAGVEL